MGPHIALMVIPVSAIIATKDRAQMLRRVVIGIVAQSYHPSELFIVDASLNDKTQILFENELAQLPFKTIYTKAEVAGAASQREQGFQLSTQPYIWFLDDDITMEPGCVRKLWEGFSFQPNVGAVNAFITNQYYTSPGRVTKFMYHLLSDQKTESFAGKIIGPAWNLLPEDHSGLPEYVQCEWLNTTCTMYRKDFLPTPVFSNFFQGYSLMEDVELSVIIAREHVLLNARTARIFHDSQPGSHKSNIAKLSSMELVNRHYITRHVLKRRGNGKLLAFEIFGIVSTLRNASGWRTLPAVVYGKLVGLMMILNITKRNF